MSAARPPAPLIVLEGIDGSGKGTQSALLADRLRKAGRRVALLSFPRYRETFFGARIGEFLNGDYGRLDQLHPFLISLLYAGDRLESKQTLETARAEYDVVILDRYVPSNIAHQSAKCDGPARAQLKDWIERIEYEIFGLPRPELVILLEIPLERSQELIANKRQRSYTDRQKDLQEADVGYLSKVRDVYLELARTTQNWRRVDVATDRELRPIESIADDVLRAATELLGSSM